MLESNCQWGAEGSAARGFEEFVETVGPEAYVLHGYIAGTEGESEIKEIVADLCESVDKSVNPLTREKKSVNPPFMVTYNLPFPLLLAQHMELSFLSPLP
jgi:hypothetical protein